MTKNKDKETNSTSETPEVMGESIVVGPLDGQDDEPADEDDPVDSADDDTVDADDDSDDEDTDSDDASEERLKAAIAEQAREDERPHSSNFSLGKILGGDILTAQLLRNNIWLIVIVVIFVVFYITNRYKVQKDLLEIDQLNEQLVDAKYRALSTNSNLTEKSRESHVIDNLKTSADSTLKQSDRPPYIVEVPEK